MKPVDTVTAQVRCDRCRQKYAPEDLRPVPRWQERPGIPETLPVPGVNHGARKGGSTVFFQPGECKALCAACCRITIEKRRFNLDGRPLQVA